MQLSCLQENLRRGLARVSRAVAGKSTLPVLSHILLSAESGQLSLVATNLELAISTWVGAQVEHSGAVALPARLLSDIINALPNDKLELTLDEASQRSNFAVAMSKH